MHCCTRKLFKHFDMQACPTCLNMESLDFTAGNSFTVCLQTGARRGLVETARQESLFACTDCKVKHRQLAENVADSSDAEHSVTLFHIVLVQAAQSGSSPTRTQQAGSSYKSRDTWGIHSTWVDWFHHRPLKVRFWTMWRENIQRHSEPTVNHLAWLSEQILVSYAGRCADDHVKSFKAACWWCWEEGLVMLGGESESFLSAENRSWTFWYPLVSSEQQVQCKVMMGVCECKQEWSQRSCIRFSSHLMIVTWCWGRGWWCWGLCWPFQEPWWIRWRSSGQRRSRGLGSKIRPCRSPAPAARHTWTSSTLLMNQQHVTSPQHNSYAPPHYICTSNTIPHHHITYEPATLGLIEYECGVFKHFSIWK